MSASEEAVGSQPSAPPMTEDPRAAEARRVEELLDMPMLVVTLVATALVAIEAGGVDGGVPLLIRALDWAVWLAFVTEAVWMLRVVPSRRAWIADHPLDLAIVVFSFPLLVGGLTMLRAVRLVRYARLLRLLPVFRGASRARELFTLTGLRWGGVIVLVAILGGAQLLRELEHGSRLSTSDGVWWATVTVLAGPMEIEPATLGGRVLLVGLAALGIGLVGLMTGAIAERFIAGQETTTASLDELSERLDRIEALLRERAGDPGAEG